MAALPVITPPSSLGEAVVPVAALTDADFEVLLSATSTQRSFSLNNAQIEALKKQVPVLENNLTYVLSSLSFLYSKIEGVRSTSHDMQEVVAALLDELDLPDEPEVTEVLSHRLALLLQENLTYSSFRKVQRLRTGLLPNAKSFRTMLDLRPDFGDKKDELEYKGLVKIIQFRVVTDSHDPSQREIVFQLDEDALTELLNTVERLKNKLSAVDSVPEIAAQLIRE
jgi:hypothetical protein